MEKDKRILRNLALRYMEIAESEENKKIRANWVDFNTKKISRPMVIINEIPWHEIKCEELENKCESDFCRQLETWFLRNLWIKNNLKTDHVLDNYIKVPIAIEGCDFSLSAKTERDIVGANKFCDLIKNEEDIQKIKFQPITVNKKLHERNANIYQDLFGDVIPIIHSGRAVLFNAWDLLETWHGVENCLIDMYDRPDFLHAIMRRITDVTHHVIDGLEKLKLVEHNQESLCFSPLYCEESSEKGTAKGAWVFGTAQIFSSVSKEMHEEFELPYAKEIFSRFGKGYYGCCEPLHDRIDMVDKIPNVKKVSISPFANVFMAAENIGAKYIMSRKPTPSYLGTSSMNWEVIEKEIKQTKKACEQSGVFVEYILKDLTSINSKPERLIEWSERVFKILN